MLRSLTAALCALLLAAIPAAAQPLSRLQIGALRGTDDQSGIGRYRSFGSVPDVSGDGVADLVLGEADENSGFGLVTIYDAVRKVTIREITSPQTIQAERLGATVVGLPDIDGDGRGDVAVWASAASVGAFPGAGKVYLFSGATGALLRTLTSPNAASGGGFGATLVVVPDMTGDGVPDLAVGAPDEDAPDRAGVVKVNVGRAYVFNLKTGALARSFVSENPYPYAPPFFGFRTRGSDIGTSLAGLGDVDGDGLGDLAVGAPGEWTGNLDDTSPKYDGRLYVFRSRAARTLLRSPNPTERSNFAASLARVQDVDGDGAADLLVGAPGEFVNATVKNAGRVYVVSGRTGAPLRAFVSPDPSDVASFGTQVGTIPDMNRDGVAEIFAVENTSCCDDSDALYVFDGRSGALLYSIETPYINWQINWVAGLPDVDGDGRGDLAVGFEVGSLGGVEQIRIFSGDVSRAEVEPNDDTDTAQRLGGASPRVVEGVAHGQDGGVKFPWSDNQYLNDVFRFDLTSPGLTVALTRMTEDADLYLFRQTGATTYALVQKSIKGGRYDADGNVISIDDELISIPTLAAGTYFIGVNKVDEYENGADTDWTPYTLTVTGALTPSTAGDADPTAAGPAALAVPAPNPFRGATSVAFTLAAAGPARLSLVDVLGREVAVAFDGAAPAGETRAALDGRGLAAGVYVLRLEAAGQVATRRVTVAR